MDLGLSIVLACVGFGAVVGLTARRIASRDAETGAPPEPPPPRPPKEITFGALGSPTLDCASALAAPYLWNRWFAFKRAQRRLVKVVMGLVWSRVRRL
jgi:hypothetical protein